MYGETGFAVDELPMEVGLSPRVRGNLLPAWSRYMHSRSIPACTGKPTSPSWLSHGIGVYPRVYGETLLVSKQTPTHRGLSPRVRGNLLPAWSRYMHSRSIPACTGKPTSPSWLSHGIGVYPRVYGETWTGVLDSIPTRGLSPRVRGNPPRRPGCPTG